MYGIDDSSYKAAGEIEGITKLVDAFYEYMDQEPEAEKIRNMHSRDLAEPRRKLAYFLSGWLGGPKLYFERYGGINIPSAHKPLNVGIEDRDAWLFCMEKAIQDQPYKEDFKLYLLSQLRVPAERIRRACLNQ